MYVCIFLLPKSMIEMNRRVQDIAITVKDFDVGLKN